MTPRNFLIRGLLAGFLAGIFAFAVGYVVGEPQVDAAIAVEEAGAAAAPVDAAPAEAGDAEDGHADDGHSHAEEGGTEVSRANQSTWGLATGLLAVGTAIGGVVGLVSAFAVGRLGRLRPSQSTAVVALVGFVAWSLVPFLKYPATPPAVGNEETLADRTLSYFSMQGISVVAAVVAVLVARRLLADLSVYRTLLVAAGGYLVVVVAAATLLPTVNEIGAFPADTLWYFRVSSLLTLTTMWAVIGIVLAGLVGRLHEQETLTAARRDLAASL